MERGWLGEKRGQGFYKRVGKARKEIQALDLHTLEYHPAQKPKFPSVEAAKAIEDLPQRLRALVAGNDRAGAFHLDAVPRFRALLRGDGARDLGPHRRDRSRDAVGLRLQATARSSCGMRSAFRETVERMKTRRLRDSGECRAHARVGRARVLPTGRSRRAARNALLRSERRAIRAARAAARRAGPRAT